MVLIKLTSRYINRSSRQPSLYWRKPLFFLFYLYQEFSIWTRTSLRFLFYMSIYVYMHALDEWRLMKTLRCWYMEWIEYLLCRRGVLSVVM